MYALPCHSQLQSTTVALIKPYFYVGLSEPGCLKEGSNMKFSSFFSAAAVEAASPMGEQKWVRDIIWMPGPLFDEVLKVSLRSKLRFSNMISLLANYIMNNLQPVHYSGYHIWSTN